MLIALLAPPVSCGSFPKPKRNPQANLVKRTVLYGGAPARSQVCYPEARIQFLLKAAVSKMGHAPKGTTFGYASSW